MGFYGSPLNPMSLTCGLFTVEATPGKKNQVKNIASTSITLKMRI